MKITQNYGSGVNLWPFNQKTERRKTQTHTHTKHSRNIFQILIYTTFKQTNIKS